MASFPIRTCIGCGEKFPQDELIRIKLSGGKLVINPRKTFLPGRSVYLCYNESCWNSALRKGSITFRTAKYSRLTVTLEQNEINRFLLQLRQFSKQVNSNK